MKLSFSKYSGCGNDFILIDNQSLGLSFTTENVQRLCHRQNGIGADGIILLERSDNLDFRMRIFNSDGSEAEMCGNGLRCLIQFIHKLGNAKKTYSIETLAGPHRGRWQGNLIEIEMEAPERLEPDICLEIGDYRLNVDYLTAGVPHAVMFVRDLEKFDLAGMGPQIRHHPRFSPKGTNFSAAKLSGRTLRLRTYERGVEQETLACGTAAIAAATAAAQKFSLPFPIEVEVASGDLLTVSVDNGKAALTGPAKEVYSGEILIEP